jgi:hypothetical protein
MARKAAGEPARTTWPGCGGLQAPAVGGTDVSYARQRADRPACPLPRTYRPVDSSRGYPQAWRCGLTAGGMQFCTGPPRALFQRSRLSGA